MKIAVVGSHGVGKTTLAKALAKKLKINYIHDIVREEAIKKGFTINEKTPPEVHFWLTFRQWELEQTTPQDWIADKSLFDYLVYGEIVLKEKIFRQTIRKIVKSSAKYDSVFYLPIEFGMEIDGLRSENLDFQKLVDKKYRKILSELKIEYITLSGSVKERLSQALKFLN